MAAPPEKKTVSVQYEGGELVTHESVADIAALNGIPVEDHVRWGYFLCGHSEAVGKRGAGTFPLAREMGGKEYRVLKSFDAEEGERVTLTFTRWTVEGVFPCSLDASEEEVRMQSMF